MTAAAPEPFRYNIRRAVADDARFIVETTAKVRQPREQGWREWERDGRRNAEDDLRDGSTHVIEADGVLLGFVTMLAGALRMVYVKREFRGNGFGVALLTAAGALDDFPRVRVIDPTSSFRAWSKRRGFVMLPGR